MSDKVDQAFRCPCCHNDDMDALIWFEGGEWVRCVKCGAWYDPEEA